MDSPRLNENESDYYIYDALVENWLKREKWKNKPLDTQHLLEACIILATVLNMRGIRKIQDDDLDRLIDKIDDVKPIKRIHIKGRSLINRDSEGNWRFSHFSIQEFCVAKLLLEKKVFTPKKPIIVSDLILKWMVEFRKKPNFCELLDFHDVQLENADLAGICLPGANLAGLNFKGADLNGADLSGADLTEANISSTNLVKADLNGVKKDGANFKRARLYLIRSKPLTVSKDDFIETFGLTNERRPLEYIDNDFEDRGEIVFDYSTGFMWQKAGSDRYMAYQNAAAYVKDLNQQKFAGFDDWRLPTLPELLSLMEEKEQANGLYIDPIFHKEQNWCWSCDIVKGSSGLAWVVIFSTASSTSTTSASTTTCVL